MDLSSPQILDLPEHLDLVPTCSSSSSSTKMPVYRRSNLFSIPNPDDDPFDLASVSSRGSAGSSSLATPTPDVGLLVNIGRDSDVFHSNKTHSGALENWELLKCEAQSLAGDLKKVNLTASLLFHSRFTYNKLNFPLFPPEKVGLDSRETPPVAGQLQSHC